MKKLLYLIPILLLVFLATSCKSKKDKTVSKVMRNKEECIQILRSTGRPGMENVIRQLEMSDFFTRGAGGHHTEEGGLVQHSLEVYRIMRVIACFFPSDSIAIVAILPYSGVDSASLMDFLYCSVTNCAFRIVLAWFFFSSAVSSVPLTRASSSASLDASASLRSSSNFLS